MDAPREPPSIHAAASSDASQPTDRPCLTDAWHRHEREVHRWLLHRVGQREEADDVLQDVFLKALRQGRRFCDVANPRAWLFEVARNTLTDRLRVARVSVPLPEDLAEELSEPEAIDSLTMCLPRALAELAAPDRDVLTNCDLDGMTQDAYARARGLSLTAVKSRLLRARRRLRDHLAHACQVRFDPLGQVCCFVPRPPLSGPEVDDGNAAVQESA